MPNSSRELLDTAYSRLGFEAGDLFPAEDRPTVSTSQAWVNKDVAAFLQGMASPEGGLRANGRAPCADLLSTFTGAWTLERLGASSVVREGSSTSETKPGVNS